MPASEILRIVFGFIAVIGMIGACAYAARKAGFASLPGASGKKRRLAVSETLPLDARRRLALVRCDDAEYLVILGPSGETLVAGGLEAPPREDASPAQQPANPFAGFGSFAEKFRQAGLAQENKDAA
ncbi:FliO/MopB family protein [Hyphococcus luteus]|uniref:Flagellar assembly protein FliO n=1 Tax=Hyphococcus luteus TaxID=2058213 RepID=A0A2S7K923_9PROT|nr:flagellar biosynthetic protein FliO [Marinicaulis flavus]PQA89000.1 hypothetical protein CW354_03360 [Marinicaulis flavus]